MIIEITSSAFQSGKVVKNEQPTGLTIGSRAMTLPKGTTLSKLFRWVDGLGYVKLGQYTDHRRYTYTGRVIITRTFALGA